ncbi:MAG: MerR family transcriptional regulator [Burkholderiales bacterium]|nr:MerR family transcriptional regulator [Burkholderiales bacterium]
MNTASIGAVERDTGLSKDTLRVWERRYGFPTPLRDEAGERVYSEEQVQRLRAIKRLMDRGMRPGKLMALDQAELQRLAQSHETASDATASATSAAFIELLRAHRGDDLRRALGRAMVQLGLARFVTELVAPLATAVGEAWVRGELEIFEEHLFTESLQGVLRGAIAGMPEASGPPRILLTTFPGEQHSLGLLMAESMLVMEGAQCVSLGTEMPVWDIARAAQAHEADVVALSFSLAYSPTRATEGLAELRRMLAPTIDLWAGASSAVLGRRTPQGVAPVDNVAAVARMVADWRLRHGS